MSDFVSIYKDEVLTDIEKTKEIVKSLEDKNHKLTLEEFQHVERAKKLATICEAAILRGIKDQQWLGSSARVNATAPFDEKANGVDLMVQFEGRDNSHIGLAIDVTYAHDLNDKFNRIRNEIRLGSVAHIKYFKSANGSYKGEVDAPRVVVGMDAKRLGQVVSNWDSETKNPFEDILMQETFVEEIRMQLLAFEAYARSVGKPEIAAIYAKDLQVLDEVLEHRLPKSTHEDRSSDKVYRAIEENLGRFRVIEH